MTARRLVPTVLLLVFSSADGGAQGVPLTPELRAVRFGAVPDLPAMGEPFDLHLTLRLRPGILAEPAPVLPAGTDAEGWGPGRFSVLPAQGDSVDLLAVYPVVAFREGLVGLPDLPLRLVAVEDADEGGWRWEGSEGDPATMALPEGSREVLLRLGALPIASILPSDPELPTLPRPAADVLGGDRSTWGWIGLVLLWMAGGVLALAGIARARSQLAGRIRDMTSGEVSPRGRALTDLDRALATGWHRNGRVADFYTASTDAFRSFAAHLDPAWGSDLTLGELASGVRSHGSAEGTEALVGALDTAERVRFGRLRPSAERAEEDWSRIRDWVREAPGGVR